MPCEKLASLAEVGSHKLRPPGSGQDRCQPRPEQPPGPMLLSPAILPLLLFSLLWGEGPRGLQGWLLLWTPAGVGLSLVLSKSQA